MGACRHPSEVLQPGQIVEVKVVSVEPGERGRPRRASGSRCARSRPIRGPPRARSFRSAHACAARCATWRASAPSSRSRPGLDGLVHVSKLVLDRRVSHPRQVVSVGDRGRGHRPGRRRSPAPHQPSRWSSRRSRERDDRGDDGAQRGAGRSRPDQRAPQPRHVRRICWRRRSAVGGSRLSGSRGADPLAPE